MKGPVTPNFKCVKNLNKNIAGVQNYDKKPPLPCSFEVTMFYARIDDVAEAEARNR